ncbi:MAG TPA: UDP-N-acetylmuramoyl-tripeptide--D-alanyl-D-alanine ligase [Caldisericia bacterium]|nr:UDP-N-acetylmuramoyl-tripeptide--D-alanyl-D-alanine ligase [Caldisericia bacterium]HPF49167.1 UDP-N-acetylmuramoyl-tripeptide--D-alanyl-D-alanine ligase [Caldisericia bacterium]HPI82969.1 UDP-N-acetylmuramoyl-tripeptide--D-alanyl-D-alanine ligase [Caldisericia bacterium]HPQ92196.1 UDP-N-acetylmuramoyl-tripeptide--D-alanyl-D-alanine ligase [Caldisericia bacterium]HRV74706.1 UDP-N-acetylmuramoyl-tripeptide--D-alanyl-D-alanine ligase [Caldisericia bacterium]
MNLTTHEIANILGKKPVGKDTQVVGFAVDSRITLPFEVFFCIAGLAVDGHDYAQIAVKKGACLIVAEKPLDIDAPVLVVESVQNAMIKVAHAYTKKFNIDTVGVTGSAGKTTTKELIASILKTKYKTEKNDGNKNTPIGIPISLKALKGDTEIFVAEMSSSHWDEMPQLLQIIQPRVGVVTNIGQTHLELLGSVEGVAKSKSKLISSLPVGGVAILNADDPLVAPMFQVTRCRVVTYGIKNKANVEGSLINEMFTATSGRESYSIKPKTPTTHFLYDALAAVAVGLEYGVPLKTCIEVVADFEPVEGRGRVITTATGIHIIDETYNANPMSMKETLNALEARNGRRFAVIGDMMQLGTDTLKIHKELGEFISKLRLDGVFFFGELTTKSSEVCPGSQHFTDKSKLTNTLIGKLRKGDWVLIKGSNSLGMADIIKMMKEEL